MNLATIILVVYLLGAGTGILVTALWRYAMRRNATFLCLINPDTMRITPTWRKLKGRYPSLKIDGQTAKPPFSGSYRHDVGDSHSGFLLNTKNGLPIRIEDDPDRLQRLADEEREGMAWPTAYDVAEAYSDGREQRVSEATKDKGADYAKIGAIAGGFAVLLLVVVLGLLFQLVRGVGVV